MHEYIIDKKRLRLKPEVQGLFTAICKNFCERFSEPATVRQFTRNSPTLLWIRNCYLDSYQATTSPRTHDFGTGPSGRISCRSHVLLIFLKKWYPYVITLPRRLDQGGSPCFVINVGNLSISSVPISCFREKTYESLSF